MVNSSKLASAALSVAGLMICANAAFAADGIAIATHREQRGDLCFGVGRMVFGDLVRHDIKDSRVVKSTVIYKGKARAACINFAGEKVAFLKLDGHVCVINIDGTGFKELTNSKSHNGSAMDWPMGDWVYYTQEARPPRGGFRQIVDTDNKTWGQRVREQLRDQKTIRRINIQTGDDEWVAVTSGPIWQLYLTARATKSSGRYAITGGLFDFGRPRRRFNRRGLACGSGVSASGRFVCEVDPTKEHDYLRIWDWNLTGIIRLFKVNEWNLHNNDGRKYFYRPRWAVNSDDWVILTNGTDPNCGYQSNMVLYNWREKTQIQVTSNPLDTDENDEGEDFWLAGVPADFPPPAEDETPTATPPRPRIKQHPFEVEAKLTAITKAPRPAEMAPYSDALVVFEYEVQKVIRGTCTQKNLRVAHWGVLDTQETRATRMKLGTRVDLIAVAFENHPDLEGEFIRNALPENHDLPLYYSEVFFGINAGLRPLTQEHLRTLSSPDIKKSVAGALALGKLFDPEQATAAKPVPGAVLGALRTRLRARCSNAQTWPVRRAGAGALGMIKGAAAALYLRHALEDPHLEVVIAATQALGAVLPADELKELMREKLDGAGHGRSAAARYLAPRASADDLESLVGGLYADDWRARKHSAAGIATIAAGGTPISAEACRKLAELLGDDTPNVMKAAQDALMEYGRSDDLRPAIEKALLEEADGNPLVWEYAAKVLGALKTRNAPELLARMILEDQGKGHWRTQVNAARALAAIGVKSDDVEMALVTCIQSDVRQVRSAGEAAIRALWSEDH
ncbi:MAG: HEAT repeat domain-containing protein [Planctomycetes bacterium]|nr:HEAT repeat domain-containing protein [Planctomycetota bacterium]